ncbi:acetate--CoA ligase [Oecophyllibacter saccharovorans]|uniref:Acetyl-coenzyme A synthetase n=1 Tax=Oecophyllibacter saccharovorans TaxID=2558360 RepID=A0A506URS8_9PROT|nr:acetate--CoA ligase [Oecophyllibacter saccharovorans]TPW36048.1 acetate--CoA ligase [Oecophyllibacter saccharovorans]
MSAKLYPVLESTGRQALIDRKTYQDWYRESLEDPDAFWGRHGRRIDWFTPYTKVKNTDFTNDVTIRWYEDGVTNAAYNCLDRHLPARAGQTAILWESDDGAEVRRLTYDDLHEQVCRMANVLKKHGVRKGDRVSIYMPMVPEVTVAMLACARIGAVHSVVFSGFSPEALASRIIDCDSHFLITCDEGLRGGRTIALKNNADKAIDIAAAGGVEVEKTFVVQRTGGPTGWKPGRDLWVHEESATVSADCPPEPMNAEDPLFILYTSGSTGAPKGVVHTTGGYLVYASMTHEYVFDTHEGDVYWCMGDVGWITGHSYIVYGPLANGTTTVMFEGVPTYPHAGRVWEMINRHGVNSFYTAPTAIRALMGTGHTPPDMPALRLLASVGEPINPEAWEWYYHAVGKGRAPIMDTWWQTEAGGILITPLPGVTDLKPGSATRPFFGIRPELVDAEGQVLEGATAGNLCLADSWPGQMRTIHGNHQRFVDDYFRVYPGKYFTGDGCRRDSDGDYWITGRVDDVLNISGHRLGTAEIEAALDAHPLVAEAAVVGYPHPLKGQGIYCYVTLMASPETAAQRQDEDTLRRELVQQVRREIGPIASPDHIQFAPDLPKTRSGKIMRRLLRKIAEDELDSLGDTTTLADPSVVDDLIANRQNRRKAG